MTRPSESGLAVDPRDRPTSATSPMKERPGSCGAMPPFDGPTSIVYSMDRVGRRFAVSGPLGAVRRPAVGCKKESPNMSDARSRASESNPLADLDEWESFLQERYPQPRETVDVPRLRVERPPGGPRVLPAESPPSDARLRPGQGAGVPGQGSPATMGIWEAMEFLNTLVDDSDPDTELTQIEHLMQTAEAIRADGHPRWFILTGLIHDLGKILCLFGEPQWAVVGDTFPVGCRYSEQGRLPRVLPGQSRLERARVPDRVRDLRAGVRARPGPHVVGTRRIPLPRRQGLSARRGPGDDPLPLVLRGPSRRGVHRT